MKFVEKQNIVETCNLISSEDFSDNTQKAGILKILDNFIKIEFFSLVKSPLTK